MLTFVMWMKFVISVSLKSIHFIMSCWWDHLIVKLLHSTYVNICHVDEICDISQSKICPLHYILLVGSSESVAVCERQHMIIFFKQI